MSLHLVPIEQIFNSVQFTHSFCFLDNNVPVHSIGYNDHDIDMSTETLSPVLCNPTYSPLCVEENRDNEINGKTYTF